MDPSLLGDKLHNTLKKMPYPSLKTGSQAIRKLFLREGGGMLSGEVHVNSHHFQGKVKRTTLGAAQPRINSVMFSLRFYFPNKKFCSPPRLVLPAALQFCSLNTNTPVTGKSKES